MVTNTYTLGDGKLSLSGNAWVINDNTLPKDIDLQVTAFVSGPGGSRSSGPTNVILLGSAISVSSVGTSSLQTTSAVITWELSAPAPGQVEYGTTNGLGTLASVSASASSHSIAINGLTPNTLYHFRVFDPTGAEYDQSGYTFRTTQVSVSGESSLVNNPETVDALYRYILRGNLATYTDAGGQDKQILAYWSGDNRHLHVRNRDFPSGELGQAYDIHSKIGGASLEYDSHNHTAIGVAPNGVMFVCGNMHVDDLRIAKTATPYDISSFQAYSRNNFGSNDTNRITYPAFTNFPGDGNRLYFSAREQEAGQGAPRFRWILWRYDHNTDNWTNATPHQVSGTAEGNGLTTGINLRFYATNPVADNNALHIFGHWRDEELGGGTVGQRQYLHLYTTNGSTWNTYVGGQVDLPIWYNNGRTEISGYTGTVLPNNELIWQNPTADPKPNGAGYCTLDSAGNPHALIESTTGAMYHLWWNGSSWQQDALSSWSSSSHDIIPVGSGVGAIISLGDELQYRSLNSNDTSYNNPVVLSKGQISNSYVVWTDKYANTTNFDYMSITLVRNTHYGVGDRNGSNPQQQKILTIPHADLETFSGVGQSSSEIALNVISGDDVISDAESTSTLTITASAPNRNGESAQLFINGVQRATDVIGSSVASFNVTSSQISSWFNIGANSVYVSGSGATSNTRTVTYQAPAGNVLVNGPSATTITTTSAEIVWTLSQNGPGAIEWGTTSSLGNFRSPQEDSFQYGDSSSPHSQGLTGLPPGTTIYYRVYDHRNGTYDSGVMQFDTLQPSSSGAWDWGVQGGRIVDFNGNESYGANEIIMPARHPYSKPVVPTIDNGIFLFANSVRLGTHPFAPHPNQTGNAPFSKIRVSYTTPDRLWGGVYDSGDFGYWTGSSDVKTIRYTFPHTGSNQEQGASLMNEGNSSYDDRFWVVNCGTNRNTLYAYDDQSQSVLGTLSTPSNFDWAAFSPNGNYIVLKQNTNPAQYTRYNPDFTNPVTINTGNSGAHECLHLNKSGQECLIALSSSDIRYVVLSNPGTNITCPAGAGNGSGHISAATSKPGWCVVSCGQYSGPSYIAAFEFDNPVANSYFLANHGVSYGDHNTYNRQPQVSASIDAQRIFFHRSDTNTRMIVKP